MKHTTKSALSLLMALILALFALTGCGSSKTETASDSATQQAIDADELSAQALIACVESNLADASGYSMTLEEALVMEYDGETMETYISYYAEVTADPEASKILLTVDYYGYTAESTIYAFRDGNSYTVYTEEDGIWYMESDVSTDLFTQLSETYDVFGADYSWTRREGTETLDGTECYVLVTEMSGDALTELMDSLDLGISTDGDGESVELVLYVDAQTLLPLYTSMDFTALMAPLLATLIDDDSFSLDCFSVDVFYGDFDAVAEIVLPDEATDAIAYDSSDDDYESELLVNDDGSYTLVDWYDESVTLNISTPDGYTLDEYSDSTGIFFDVDTQDDDAFAWGYVYYVIDSDYTQDDMVSYAEYLYDSYDEYCAEYYEEFSSEALGDIMSVAVNGSTVYYTGVIAYADGYIIQDLVAWTFVDGICLEVTIYNCDDSGATDSAVLAGDFDALMNTLFSVVG